MIEARGLTKRYRSATVVDDPSFTVAPGQVTGFPGPDGSGKSTTMCMIVGLDRPSAGARTGSCASPCTRWEPCSMPAPSTLVVVPATT